MTKTIKVIAAIALLTLPLAACKEELRPERAPRQPATTDVKAQAPKAQSTENKSNKNQPDPAAAAPVDFEIGTFITPRNFPKGLFDQKMMSEYYSRTASLGRYTGSQMNWFDSENKDLNNLWHKFIKDARSRGLKFIVEMNLLTRDASGVGTPPSVKGSSFTDKRVRKAYQKWALELAAQKPDVLLLAVELNNLLIHGNPKEFNAFKAFAPKLYETVKMAYPEITISISFQLDQLYLRNEVSVLEDFANALDLYSFSTYPTAFGIRTVDAIPGGADYFTRIRKHLPANARTAIAESGWASRGGSSAAEQAKFYRRMPQLFSGLKPEFVVVAYLHDLPTSKNSSKDELLFSTMGLFDADGSQKPAVKAIREYKRGR